MSSITRHDDWERIRPLIADLNKRLDLPRDTQWLVFEKDQPAAWCSDIDFATAGATAYSEVQFLIDKLTEPQCSHSLCRDLRPHIMRICEEHQWPPGYPVLIYNPDGTYCYCCCGGCIGDSDTDEVDTKGGSDRFTPAVFIT
jgi:hypothetical protein